MPQQYASRCSFVSLTGLRDVTASATEGSCRTFSWKTRRIALIWRAAKARNGFLQAWWALSIQEVSPQNDRNIDERRLGYNAKILFMKKFILPEPTTNGCKSSYVNWASSCPVCLNEWHSLAHCPLVSSYFRERLAAHCETFLRHMCFKPGKSITISRQVREETFRPSHCTVGRWALRLAWTLVGGERTVKKLDVGKVQRRTGGNRSHSQIKLQEPENLAQRKICELMQSSDRAVFSWST